MEKRFQEDVEDKSKTIREMKIKLKQAQKNNGQWEKNNKGQKIRRTKMNSLNYLKIYTHTENNKVLIMVKM